MTRMQEQYEATLRENATLRAQIAILEGVTDLNEDPVGDLFTRAWDRLFGRNQNPTMEGARDELHLLYLDSLAAQKREERERWAAMREDAAEINELATAGMVQAVIDRHAPKGGE